MKTSELVFIGIKGSVIALNRSTGEQVWATRLRGSDFVNVIVEDDMILASCYGEIYCLDSLTGQKLWHNRLKGYGMDLATIATEANPGGGQRAVLAQKRRRDEAASSSATAT
jgi:hypothetical protein